MIDFRMRIQPDPRIMMHSVRKVRHISVLVLLDLTRQACVLLSDAINKIGDPFAIHGFCSDGRHEVVAAAKSFHSCMRD